MAVTSPPTAPMASQTPNLTELASFEQIRVECADSSVLRVVEVTVRDTPSQLYSGKHSQVLIRAEGYARYFPADEVLPFANGTIRSRVHVPFANTYEVYAVRVDKAGEDLITRLIGVRRSAQDWSLDMELPVGTVGLKQQTVRGCPPPIATPLPALTPKVK